MARDQAKVGNYSISVQKFRRVIQMIEKFMQRGCAPPLQPKWKIVVEQLTAEMNLVIEIDQVKANFSMGVGGLDAVRKQTALEKMDVQILQPGDRPKPPSLPFMPQRSPALSSKNG